MVGPPSRAAYPRLWGSATPLTRATLSANASLLPSPPIHPFFFSSYPLSPHASAALPCLSPQGSPLTTPTTFPAGRNT